MTYRCKRVLNNSVVLAEKISDGSEVILLGKGIGVTVSKNKIPIVPTNMIQREYELKDSQENDYLQELVNSVSAEIITITMDILKKAETMLGTKFRTNLFFTIVDHLSFAIERSKEGIESNYFYLAEMKILLKEEYEVSKALVDYVNRELNTNLKDDESVLLAMHFANSKTDIKSTEEEIIQEIMDIIALKLDIENTDKQINLHRLKTHLRLFLKTNFSRSSRLKRQSFEEIKNTLSKEYKAEFQCAQLIVEFLKKKYRLEVSRDEVIYLTMHIIPIVTKE